MISAQEAKALANKELSPFVASHATREQGVWIVSYVDPTQPDVRLDGGGLVVTDEGEVDSIGSTPDAVDLWAEAQRSKDDAPTRVTQPARQPG